jgi:hypothetical protein
LSDMAKADTPPPEGLPDDPFAGERFIRVVGKRSRPAPGEPPSAEARAVMNTLAVGRTRAPKGVFIYRSHEEANRDRDAWTLEAMVERQG